jgi:hypothetical protein
MLQPLPSMDLALLSMPVGLCLTGTLARMKTAACRYIVLLSSAVAIFAVDSRKAFAYGNSPCGTAFGRIRKRAMPANGYRSMRVPRDMREVIECWECAKDLMAAG